MLGRTQSAGLYLLSNYSGWTNRPYVSGPELKALITHLAGVD